MKFMTTLAKAADVQKISLSESTFRYEMNEDKMANDLLSDGIRRFAADARAMEGLIEKTLWSAALLKFQMLMPTFLLC